MRICLILSLFAMIFSFIGCNSEKDVVRVEYYKKYRLAEFKRIVGRFQMDKKFAQNTNSYRFSYDRKGRPVLIEFLKNGKRDKDNSSDSVFHVAKVKVNYLDELTTEVTFYDKKGQATSASPKIFMQRFKLAGNKRLLEMQNLGVNGKKVLDGSGIAMNVYVLNKAGNPIKTFFADIDGKYIPMKSGVFKMHHEYADDSQKLVTKRYNKKGKLMMSQWGAVTISKFDYNDNLKEVEYLDDKEKLTEKTRYGIAMMKMRYNILGGLAEVEYYGKNRKLKTFQKKKFAVIVMKYDKFGNNKGVILLDKNRKVLK